MSESSKKTFIASILFLDIVGYSKLPVESQLDIKEHFNGVLSDVIHAIPEEERIALDTGDGAALCFLDNPEVALQVALIMRNKLTEINSNSITYEVCMGINIGPVRIVNDINQQRNVIGDGINAAQRVLSMSVPGQILVSRAFHDIVAFLTTDHMSMFQSKGAHKDKHGREHEVYAVLEGYDAIDLEKQSQGYTGSTASEPEYDAEQATDSGHRLLLAEASRQRLEGNFAQYVGPIANILVQRGIEKSASLHELYNTLKEMISDEPSRHQFEQFYRSEIIGSEPSLSEPKTVQATASDAGQVTVLTNQQLQHIEKILTQYIGPIAKVLIKRQAGYASSVESLCVVLAQHIDSEEKQQQFMNELKAAD